MGETVAHNDVDIENEQEMINKFIPDASVTDEEIAELLSGEAEVLKGHGVLGYTWWWFVQTFILTLSTPQSELQEDDAESWRLQAERSLSSA